MTQAGGARSQRVQEVDVTPGTMLGQVLHYAGVVSTGGEAKILVQEGAVRVNGAEERRRGRKLADGDVVEAGGDRLVVRMRNPLEPHLPGSAKTA
jgi:ribosome-associated protein